MSEFMFAAGAFLAIGVIVAATVLFEESKADCGYCLKRLRPGSSWRYEHALDCNRPQPSSGGCGCG